jgi:uncharacterized membrane protein
VHETLGETGPLLEPPAATLETVASVIDLIGITIVLWGFVRALLEFVLNESRRFRTHLGASCMHRVRIDLGTYILVGIEFMIASDIIQTVIKRQLKDLIFVAALVAIRTAISYFLGLEVAEVRRQQSES